MSVSLSCKGYAGKNSPEFQKHLKAVKFCIENELSFPTETEEFFRNKVGYKESLHDIKRECILEILEPGIYVPITQELDRHGNWIKIKVADIHKEVEEIIVSLL